MGWTAQLKESLNADSEVLESEVPHQIFGSTITSTEGGERGTRVLELDFTSNYGKHFRKVLGKWGIENIYGLTGNEAVPLLKNAARRLKDNPSPDHWEPTEGNAKRVLLQLACLSCMAPHGVWWIHH